MSRTHKGSCVWLQPTAFPDYALWGLQFSVIHGHLAKGMRVIGIKRVFVCSNYKRMAAFRPSPSNGLVCFPISDKIDLRIGALHVGPGTCR